MDLELRDRVVLVTGASRGIGRAVARTFAAEGARLAMCARDAAALEEAAAEIRERAAADVLTVAVDLTSPTGVTRATEATLARFGRIDVLVNNAGAIRGGDFLATPEAEWIADWDLKLLGYMRMARAVFPAMQRQGGGRIVNVIGVTARNPRPTSLPGGVANAALVNFTKVLADLGARWNILVTAVSPAATRTERYEAILRAEAEAGGKTVEQARADKESGYLLGRIAHPAEIADLVCFLASARASFITGICITVDGGSSRGVYL